MPDAHQLPYLARDDERMLIVAIQNHKHPLTVRRNALLAFSVNEEHIFVDRGLTGTNRANPDVREVMAAVRDRDTLLVAKLDRASRTLPGIRDIAGELIAEDVLLGLGGSTYRV